MSTEMMQAVRFHRYGSPEELIVESIPRPPSPAEGEVLVKVHAAGVNPIDVGVRAGLVQNRLPISFPAIPGVELSGVIEEVGPGVTSFVKGQAVFGNPINRVGNGSSVEYMLLGVNSLAPMPRNLNFDQAASVTHGARTAWTGLFELGDLQPGQRVLVQGGAGGVGIYAVQLAHNHGAYVIATTSTGNVDFVRGLGADEVIDYTQTKVAEAVQAVDLVYDAVGGEAMEPLWQTLKPGGILISAVAFPTEETANKYGVRCARVMYPKDLTFILQQLTAMVEAGKLKPHLRKIFPMSEAAQAHTLCETRHGRGRIILHIAD